MQNESLARTRMTSDHGEPRNVVSYYALTDAFQSKLRSQYTTSLNFVSVARLRNLPTRDFLRSLRSLRKSRVTVAIEHENARPFADPLVLLAALSGSRRIDVLWPDGSVTPVSRLAMLSHVWRAFRAQIAGRLAMRQSARALRGLEVGNAARRALAVPEAQGGAVLYLDAHLSMGLTAGGSIGHTRGVIEALVGNGFEVDYASCKKIPSEKPGTRWLPVEPVGLYAFPQELNYYLYNPVYERAVHRFLETRPYTFIYQRLSVHNFTPAVLSRRVPIPVVVEYNGSEAWAAANWSGNRRSRLQDIANQAERISLRNADLVVTVSAVLGDAVAAAGVPKERIVVYPNCISPERFDPSRYPAEERAALRARWAIDRDARVATFIGTFGAWHGADFLARAIRSLVDSDEAFLTRNKLHFLLIGDGERMPEVVANVGGEPYRRFATLTGLVPQDQAPLYLAASDIFLSPHVPNPDGSAFFGSPTKLFEYMAMERPIVAAELDQIGDILRGDGSTHGARGRAPLAQLFTPGDEAGFLAALRHVVENPAEAKAMAARARAEALSEYTWDRHVQTILSRMRELGLLKPPPA